MVEFDTTLWSVLVLGLLIGVQHALEPDHVAAVTSLASGTRSRRSVLQQGVAWAVGHALMLLAVAGSAVTFGFMMSDGLAGWLEFVVGMMLVLLGGHVLHRLIRDRVHFHVHRHDDGTVHFHAHSHADVDTSEKPFGAQHFDDPHDHVHRSALPWRALAVGLMHGLAGSAALIVLTVASAADAVSGILFVVVFGVGSVAGMAALSFAIAVPLGWTGRRLTGLHSIVRGLVGGATVTLGVVVMYETQGHVWFG
ncbi:MAG: hypothetical protein RIC16_07280 [Rhodospirillales bacterium]